ncbi:MAG TPA: dTDP-4-dehydrorhamnose 3,5-epimerase [Thermoanaerobaculia bacterium]|nr:dTDP-4-dehydrorhamnose 3,5-epimerase [Thermoanaerobaculia bacterium]
MKITETSLPGVLLLEPKVFGDDRGFFMETYNEATFAAAGITLPFVQDNHSSSRRGVLRGLHYQEPRPQGKLVRCTRGSLFDVAVDIRVGSPHFGQWTAYELSAENKRMLWVPPGFAHGFCVTSDIADLVYKCTELWLARADHSIRWDDPDLGIPWPVAEEPTLSRKDAVAPRLREAPTLPHFPPS